MNALDRMLAPVPRKHWRDRIPHPPTLVWRAPTYYLNELIRSEN